MSAGRTVAKTARRRSLLEAYRTTIFWVDAFGERIAIRPAREQPLLRTLLGKHRTWAHLTAHNPRSQVLSEGLNEVRQQALEATVRALGFGIHPGWGMGDDGKWPVERGCLVLGIDLRRARLLGELFGQLAILYGEGTGPAQIVELEGGNERNGRHPSGRGREGWSGRRLGGTDRRRRGNSR